MFSTVKDNINRKILPVPESINLSESTNGSIPIASTENSHISHLAGGTVVSFKPMYTQETMSEFSDGLHNQTKKRTKSKSNYPSKKKSKIKCPNIVQNEREPLDTNLVTIFDPVKSVQNFDSGSSINAFLSDSALSRNSMQMFATSAFQRQRTSSANANLTSNSILLPYKEGNKFMDSSYPNPCYIPIQHLANMSNNRSLLKNRLSQGSHIKTVVSDTYNVSNKTVRKDPVQSQLNLRRGTIALSSLKYDFQINTSKETLPQSSKSTYLSSNALAKDQRINLNSMYAAMGLDEDLCDVNEAGKLYPNAVWKSDASESINKCQSSLPVQDFPNVPIKIENDATLASNMSDNTLSTCDSGSQSELFSSNGMRVSMTFEAEPTYDDDLEDDLPLSFLKGKTSATTSENNEKVIKENMTSKNDLPLSLFIKRELIEDEIISNNKEVSSQINEHNNSEKPYFNSNPTVSNLKANKNLILGSRNSLAAVRIKTEPDSEIPSSEPISGISSQSSFGVHSGTSFLAMQGINTTKNHNVSGVNLKDTIKNSNSNSLHTLNDLSSFSSYKLEQNTSELNSQNTFNAAEHLGYKTSNEKLYVPPSKIAAKKKNLKKTSRSKKLDISDQFSYLLPEADESVPKNAQNTSSDNLSEMSPSSGSETNTNLASSSIPVLEVGKKTPTKAKKRKVPEKSTEFDENLPITLLIKRQKSTATDVNAPDSFLCTSSNKPANNKLDIKDFSKESYKDSPNTNLIVPNEDVCSGLYSESSNKDEKLGSVTKAKCSSGFKKKSAPKKGKNSGKKSTKKKSRKDSSELEASICNVPYSNNELSRTDVISSKQNDNSQNTNLHSNMDLSKKDESLTNTNPYNLRNDITSKFSEGHELKTDTVVYMSFEEQNDVSEEDLYSILSIKKEIDSLDNNTVKSSDNSTDVHSVIKNIKKENDLSDWESKAVDEQSCTSEDHSCSLFSSQISDVSLELSPLKLKNICSKLVTSESTVIPSESVGSNSVSKKKKKPRRSNNWYKRKKSSKASKSKNSSPSTSDKNVTKIATEMDARKIVSDTDTEKIVSETDAEKIISEISTDLPSLAIGKRPVVLIKSLLPDLENSSNYNRKEAQNSSLCLEQEVSLPIKGKKTNKSKKATRSKKSKKGGKSQKTIKPSQLHEECMNKEMSNKDSEYENDKYLDVSKDLDISQKQLSTSTDTYNQDLQTKDFRNLTEVFNVESTIHRSVSEETIYAPFDDIPDSSQEIIEIEDSPIKQTCTQNTGKKVITPLLNIAEIKEEIAEYESILAQSKIVQDTVRSTIDRSQISKTINLPDDHMISNSTNNRSTSIFGSTLPNLSDISENSIKLNKNQSIEVKKELEDKSHQNGASIVSLSANSSNTNNNLVYMHDSHNIVSSGNHAIFNKIQNPDVNLVSIKKEPSFSSQGQTLENILSIHDNCQSVIVSNTLSSNQSMDKTLPVGSINNHLQPNSTNFTQLQPKPSDFNDKIALSIKKEICNDGKSISSSSSNITSIRSQNDLIKAGVSNLSSIPSNLTNISSQENPVCSPSVLNASNTVDDEIQILNIDVSKNVPIIDLTVDNTSKLNQDAQGKLLTFNNKSIPNELAESLQSGRKENVLEINSHPLSVVTDEEFQKGTSVFSESNTVCNAQNSDPISSPKRILDQSNSSTNKSIDVQSNFEDEDICSTVERETINPFIIRKKYNEEYFQYPFPPSTVSYHSKPKNKLKTYSRINSNVLNLPIEEVESRLKSSDNVKQQFGNKLGDVIKLDKFPVSGSEVQCYHRILGIAPSQKLISKCFKSQDKKINLISSNNFSMFREFQEPINACTFENKHKNPIACSLTDIVQGITECKMLPDSDVQNTSVSYDRDCPSTDTKDSYDSYISNLSDKFMSDTQKKELKNISLKENEFSNLCVETNSNGRNSVLSCSTSDIQNSSENDFTNVNFSNIKTNVEGQLANSSDINEISCSQNILNFLTLPSKEVLDSIVNSGDRKTPTPKIETDNESILKSSKLGIKPDFSHELHLLADSHKPVEPVPQLLEINMDMSSNTNEESTISQNAANSNFNIINMPVTELRKILETAGSLHSNTKDSFEVEKDVSMESVSGVEVSMESVSNVEKQCLWKSKATFEYNHTRSGSVIDVNSKQSLENKGDGAYSGTSVESASADIKDSNLGANISAVNQLENDDSDDDYVEHEHIDNVSDDDQKESSDVKEKVEEKPIKIPQYKSRWEKIMERKSLESKEKEKTNKLLVKDRFPVSSNAKVRDKKCNVTDEVISKPIHKIPEKSKKNEFPNVKSKNYSPNVIKSKNDSPNVIKSKNDSSKVINSKNDSKSTHAEKKVSKSSLKSKNFKEKGKEKVIDDASNLFVPDKQEKKTEKKETGKKNTESSAKSNDKKASKRFYGNRVTNRGTFLTQTTPEFLKKVKIPKKKKPEISKKHVNVRSEEYHKMVKSPNINIEAKVNSYNNSYNDHYIRSEYNRNRHHFGSSRFSNSEKYKRVSMSSTRQSSISHPSHETNFSNRNIPLLSTQCSFLPRASEENIVQNRIIPLLSTQCSFPQRASEESTVQNRKIPVLSTSYSFPNRASEEDTVQNRKIPVLSTTYSFPQRSNEEDTRKISVLSTPYTFPQLSSDEEDTSQNRKIPVLVTSSSLSRRSSVESDQNRNVHNLSSLSAVLPHQSNDINMLNMKSHLNTRTSNPSQFPVTSPFQAETSAPTLELLQTIISSFKGNNSLVPDNTLPLTDNTLPSPQYLNPAQNRNQFSSNQDLPFLSTIQSDSDSLSASASYAKDLPFGAFNSLNSISSSCFSIKTEIDPSFDSASTILKNQFVPSVNSCQISSQSPQKATSTCLVPQNLKSLVGHDIIETSNVRLLMLEWSVDWLVQQQKLHDPPPISNALKKVVSSYDGFEDYYNTYFPLLLLDTWHRIYVSWTHLSQHSPYFCEITSYSVRTNYISVECQTVFNTTSHPKGVFPDEGSILMIKYGTKSNDFTIKILGYVTNVKTRRFNPVTDSVMCGYKQPKDGNYEVLQVLTLTFMGAYNSEDIDKRLPIRIHVLCNVRSTLKQNDALLYLQKSPLQRIILNPAGDALLSFALTPRNSPKEKVNECVRDITKGILSPHPLPLLTLVKAMPASDRLNIIPLLINKMKNAYKTKVLLCVRTVRALGDIAANICLHESLKLVIINKRCDTNLQFQRYLVDELVTSEVNSTDTSSMNSHLRNEATIKAKRKIFKECDVVLSLIRNCHEVFIEETFTDTECVAQMCCIVDEANLCTEPESLIPILYGISKLILIGDPDYPAKVLSKTASSYDYNRSFFRRAYDLDLITE